MSHELPGDSLLRFLARFVSEDRLRDFVIPTIADLQHEVVVAEGGRRRLACLRGYVALVRILVVPHPSFRSACRQLFASNGVKHMRNVALVGVGLCLGVVVTGIVQANRPIELPTLQQPQVLVRPSAFPTRQSSYPVVVRTSLEQNPNGAPFAQTPTLTPAQEQERATLLAATRWDEWNAKMNHEPPVFDPDAPTITVLDFDKTATVGQPMRVTVAITGSVPVTEVFVLFKRTAVSGTRAVSSLTPVSVGTDARTATIFDFAPHLIGTCDLSVLVMDEKGRKARWVVGTVVVKPADSRADGANVTAPCDGSTNCRPSF